MKLTHEIVTNLQCALIVIAILTFAFYLSNLMAQIIELKPIVHIIIISLILSLPLLIAILPGFIDG